MAGDAGVSWRELAVTRSLDSARARAESRVQRFLDAALELLGSSDAGKDFTVQEVVERSGQSLRSFYQYFGGKHELLLALFEESVRSTAVFLRERVEEEDDARERLHRFVVEYFRLCRPERARSDERGPVPVVMAEFAQQLLTAHPREAAEAFAPVVSLFGEVLEDAAEAGVVRRGVSQSLTAGIVLEAVMFNAFASTIVGVSARREEGADPAEEVWDLILNGIGVHPST
jgi:AcrR family transcriptional regulator